MSGTWYPSLRKQLEAERELVDRRAYYEGDLDWESAALELASDGNVEALEALREYLEPVGYDELVWAG